MPTDIGIAVNDLLAEHFPKILNLHFTARWKATSIRSPRATKIGSGCCASFYGPFANELAEAETKLPKLEMKDEPTDEICPNCGRPMVIKTGRFGRFISCTGYPECKTTKPISKIPAPSVPKTAA